MEKYGYLRVAIFFSLEKGIELLTGGVRGGFLPYIRAVLTKVRCVV
jgi:hypothetical protein